MTHHHPIDIDDVFGMEGRWVVAALTDQLVALAFRANGGELVLTYTLAADEAHDLGTVLRRMARKSRAEPDVSAEAMQQVADYVEAGR